MEGEIYRTAFGGRVELVEDGILLRSIWSGTRMLPWALVKAVYVGPLSQQTAYRRIEVSLASGEIVVLPAPLSRPYRADPEFDKAFAGFDHAFKRQNKAHAHDHAHGHSRDHDHEPADAIPPEYLAAAAIDAVEARGGLRRARIPAMLLAVAGIIGCGGSVHAFERDQPVYSGYRNAQPCSEHDAAAGTAPHDWCIVTDGWIQNTLADANGDITAVSLGPELPSSSYPLQSSDTDVLSEPTQLAVFRDPQPIFDGADNVQGVSYVARNGSGYVASITFNDETIQTVNSPEPQHVYDIASIIAAFSWTFLWLFVFYRRYRPGRRPRVARAMKLTLLAGFIAAFATCIRAQPGYFGVSPAWTGVLALILAVGLNALGELWYRLGVAQLRRRLRYQRPVG